MKSNKHIVLSLFAALLTSLLLFSSPAMAHCADNNSGSDSSTTEFLDYNE